MTKTPAEFFKNFQKIHLPQAERNQLRKNIVSYMRAHPPLQSRNIQPRWHTLNILDIFTLFLRKPSLVALSLALVIILGTGVSYAAGQTLPGEALYFVKVNVNEELPKLFLSQKAKARWEVQRAARRIQEATDLALTGRLTEKTTREVQKQLARHTENITEITTTLKTQGKVKTVANIHTELQAALSANEAIFVAVADEQDIADEKTEALVAAIELSEEVSKNETTNAVIALVSNTEARQSSLPQIAEETKTEAEQQTATIAQTIESVPAESPVAQKLAAAQTIQEEGERRLREGAVKESVALFQEAKTRAGEVSALVERSKEQPHVARVLREQKAKVPEKPATPPAATPAPTPLPSTPSILEAPITSLPIPVEVPPTPLEPPQPVVIPEQPPQPTMAPEPEQIVPPQQAPSIIQEPESPAISQERPKTQALPEPAQPQPGGIAVPQESVPSSLESQQQESQIAPSIPAQEAFKKLDTLQRSAPSVLHETRVNTPPKIISYPSVQTGASQNEIHFIWEAFDPDNDDLRWQIWWGDRSGRESQAICESVACTRARASHVWDASGAYTVRVRVGDGRDGFDSYSFVVTIQR